MELLKIKRYLLDRGIPPQIKGFDQMALAIKLCQEDKNYLFSLTKRLYIKIAGMYNEVWFNVERALRHALTHLDKKNYTVGSFIGTALIEIEELSEKEKCNNV